MYLLEFLKEMYPLKLTAVNRRWVKHALVMISGKTPTTDLLTTVESESLHPASVHRGPYAYVFWNILILKNANACKLM